MIVKQLDKLVSEDKYSKAGYKAEEQMAYYLKHQYSDLDKIFVFNNIRFKWLNDYTQIDHLIVHEYGMIIVESKSVTSKVRFNDRREWNRWWNGRWEGMQNPVAQAKRQASSLRKMLNHNKEKLLKKILGKTLHSFNKMPVDCIVAISDKCVGIIRPDKNDYPNVIKAEQVTDSIDEIIKRYKKEDGPLSLKVPWMLSRRSIARIKEFILDIHDPVAIKKVYKDSPPILSDDRFKPKPTIKSPIKPLAKQQKIHTYTRCPDCKQDITIRYVYSFHWHCESCGKNIPIKYDCPVCNQKLEIREEGQKYNICCDSCGIKDEYYTKQTKPNE